MESAAEALFIVYAAQSLFHKSEDCESGAFPLSVGFPAKSVVGGIVGMIPRHMGVGVFAPALDKHGNSVAGIHFHNAQRTAGFEHLSKNLAFFIYLSYNIGYCKNECSPPIYERT